MKPKIKINGKDVAQTQRMDNVSYNTDWTENVMFLRRIIGCLKGENSKDNTKLLIKQLEDRIIDVVNQVKSEAAPPWLRDNYIFDNTKEMNSN